MPVDWMPKPPVATLMALSTALTRSPKSWGWASPAPTGPKPLTLIVVVRSFICDRAEATAVALLAMLAMAAGREAQDREDTRPMTAFTALTRTEAALAT